MYLLDLEKLKKVIEDKGHKQRWIAQRIGVTERVFNNMLNARSKWDVVVYYKFCVLFGFQYGDFIMEVKESKEVG